MKRIQFVSNHLVEQIKLGEKTASVVQLNEVNLDEDEYNHALVVGEYYEVYDNSYIKQCTIRIIAMELCQWNEIPERLWRGETNKNAEEFRQDHIEYFFHDSNPKNNFEFVAYYFELVKLKKFEEKKRNLV